MPEITREHRPDFHGRNAVAPLKPVTAGTTVSAWSVAPARKGGRGLKHNTVKLLNKFISGSARSKGEAKIELLEV